ADSVLIPELVDSCRLRRTRTADEGGGRSRQPRTIAHLLIEVEPEDFRRKGEVLDRGPAGDNAKHCCVVVRIASVGHALASVYDAKRGAVLPLCGVQVTYRAIIAD